MSKAVLSFRLEEISSTYRALSPEEQMQVRQYLAKNPDWWPTGSITSYTHPEPCGPGSYPAGHFDRLLVKPTRWQRFKGWLSDLWAKVW